MNQGKLERIIDLERKFQLLSDKGHPYVVDPGFFLDAVFNVTSILKKADDDSSGMQISDSQFEQELKVIGDLYESLKEFELLYNNCINRI